MVAWTATSQPLTGSNSQEYVPKNQEAKKSIDIKNLGRNPPPRPALQKDPWPRKFFMLGPLFPSEYRKKSLHKEFWGGGLGGPEILYATPSIF